MQPTAPDTWALPQTTESDTSWRWSTGVYFPMILNVDKGKAPLRRERLPTPVFWPGEFDGLYSPWDHKELDTTERLSLHTHLMLTEQQKCLWSFVFSLLTFKAKYRYARTFTEFTYPSIMEFSTKFKYVFLCHYTK